MNDDPFLCDGCHTGNWSGFDHFCGVFGVKTEELPLAFAAYLGGKTGWDGEFGEVAE